MSDRNYFLEKMERFLRCRLADEVAGGKRFRPSMTISRQCGIGMNRIDKNLVGYLDEVDDSTDFGWALFDQALVGKVIGDYKLPDLAGLYLDENTKFPVKKALVERLNLDSSKWTFFNYTADTIRKLCELGNTIVMGRAGNFVTADLKNTFHVRLVGSEKKRIEHTAARYKMPLNKAGNLVSESDKRRSKFVERYAASNINSADYYHLVINTDNLPDDVLVRVLADTLLEWASGKERELKALGI